MSSGDLMVGRLGLASCLTIPTGVISEKQTQAITYIHCYKIVLMFYNGLGLNAAPCRNLIINHSS